MSATKFARPLINRLYPHLREIREAKGVSQELLAATIGVSRQTLVNWENGNSEPVLRHAFALSRHLGIPINKLWTDGA